MTGPKYTCVAIILFNQHLDVPHLSGGWIVMAREKCSPMQILNKRGGEKKSSSLGVWKLVSDLEAECALPLKPSGPRAGRISSRPAKHSSR